jgi:GTP-binding protein
MDIRNIAIIAHVDHGKTTLTDALLRQNGMVKDDSQSMDSNALEQERGITIYAKNTALYYKDTKINIVDTPGHADFGSEVERVLRSIDSVLLVVDAQEGPMPQTKFVLKKSLELGLKPIVVINKIDKPAARPDAVHDMVLELFMDLGATDEQLDFATVFAIGVKGIAMKNLGDESENLNPLLDMVLENVKLAENDTTKPFRMQPFNLGYDNYLGRLAVGRIYEGIAKSGQKVFVKNNEGVVRTGTITKLFSFEGFEKKDVAEAQAGDIVMIAGIPDIYIGETISIVEDPVALPAITVDEPTISVDLFVNNSPFAGKEGKFVTTRQIRDRLEKELEVNVGLRVDYGNGEVFRIFGRGEMHIAVLLENMRREGFEMQVSMPQVIIKEEDGVKMEPFEELTIDIPESATGVVIEKVSKLKGQMIHMGPEHGMTRLIFEIPTRGLLGYRGQFIMDTRGEGIMAARVIGFKPHVGNIDKRESGAMISMITGKALGYALFALQERGALYIGPNVDVYEGQVIGNVSKGNDLVVNPTKGKKLSNVRASGTDDAITLVPPIEVTLERGLEILSGDEFLEITPKNIRLRKKILREGERKR